MLAIGRALMRRPSYLLIDEPSLGLAPKVIDSLFATIRKLADQGVGVLVVEQNIDTALSVADHAIVFQRGRQVMSDNATAISGSRAIVETYLGEGT